ncbi:HDOD domain-containing protein [Oscillospiraceae bacterium WX1]
MEFYIARHPVFDKGRNIFGYKLHYCRQLSDHFYAGYREPDDAEALYRGLCFDGFDESPDKPKALVDFSEELIESLIPLFPREDTIVCYVAGDNSESTVLRDCKTIGSHGYSISYDGPIEFIPRIAAFVDFVRVDFRAQDPNMLYDVIQKHQDRIRFNAYRVETWDDYKKALAIGISYFQGEFFLSPPPVGPVGMKAFNATILRLLGELSVPEPSVRAITNIVEHDLNMTYRLLRLVNSAYIAPNFKVKTISQAVTILGLQELNQFVSALMVQEMRRSENLELVMRSLIRGKQLELLAIRDNVQLKGSEAFFTGIFSLLDIIFHRDQNALLADLPLTDEVKDALMGGGVLGSMLSMLKAYEKGRWEEFESVYKPDLAVQETLMNTYLEALEWARSIDY